jgi:hypothetical protein
VGIEERREAVGFRLFRYISLPFVSCVKSRCVMMYVSVVFEEMSLCK